MIGQERQGPMSTDDVRFLLTRKNIDGGTLIWSEGVLGRVSATSRSSAQSPGTKPKPNSLKKRTGEGASASR